MRLAKTIKAAAAAMMVMMAMPGVAMAQHGDTTITISKSQLKILEAISIISTNYMDPISPEEIAESGIKKIVQSLDPHSRYQTEEEACAQAQMANKPMGLGIECRIFSDTAVVVSANEAGPAYRAGIRPGARIDSIGCSAVCNRHLSQAQLDKIMESQQGDSTSIVLFQRKGTQKTTLAISREPAPSGIEAHYAPCDTALYIKIAAFGKETAEQLRQTLKKYPKKRLRNIIIDLRDNPGGIYSSSVEISKMFIKANVRASKSVSRNSGTAHFADVDGPLQSSRVYVLINENTASASEVVASCIQDCDEGVIIGRRSFGKGTSQNNHALSDGAVIKLSNARLISPSDRCIERHSWAQGGYYGSETAARRESGENLDPQKGPRPPDGQISRTLKHGRTVYGGIGVQPDVFVPEDTASLPGKWQEWLDSGLIDDFACYYAHFRRPQMHKEYKDIGKFKIRFRITQDFVSEFSDYIASDSRSGAGPLASIEMLGQLQPRIAMLMESRLAKALYGASACREITSQADSVFQAAMRLISRPSEYSKILK